MNNIVYVNEKNIFTVNIINVDNDLSRFYKNDNFETIIVYIKVSDRILYKQSTI